MKIWNPVIIAIGISLLINAFPLVMAFVLRIDGWAQTGWIWYFYTIPASLLLIVVGLIISLRRYFRSKNS